MKEKLLNGKMLTPKELDTNSEEAIEKENQKRAKKWISNFGIKQRIILFANGTNFSRKRKLEYELGAGGGSWTDGKKVRLSLPETWFKKAEKDYVRYMKFVAAHEIGHVNWSDFEIFVAYQQKAESYFDKKHGIKGAGRFFGELLNITEDGRIERAQANLMPGLKKYIRYVNGEEYESFLSNQLGIVPLTDYRNIVLTLSKTGLLPKGYNARIKGSETDVAIQKSMPLIIKAIRSERAKKCADLTWDMVIENEEFLVKSMKPFEIDEDLLDTMLGEDISDLLDKDKKEEEEKDKKEEMDESEGSSGNESGEKTEETDKSEEPDSSSESEDGEGNSDNSDNSSDSHSDKGSEKTKTSEKKSSDLEENSSKSSEDTSNASSEKSKDEQSSCKEKEEESPGRSSEKGSEDDTASKGADKESQDARKVRIDPLGDMKGTPDFVNQPNDEIAPQGDESTHFSDEDETEKGNAKSIHLKKSPEEDEEKGESILDKLIVITEDESVDFLDKAKEAAKNENKRVERETVQREETEVKDIEFNGVISEYMNGFDFRYVDEQFDDNGPIPQSVLNKGRGLHRDLKEIFNDKRGWTLMNQRSGMVDENQLYRAGSGLQQTDVFIKKQIPEDTNWVVSLLVDNSGSMSGRVTDQDGNRLGYKTTVAREATAMLEIALNDLVPLKIARFDVRSKYVQHARVRGWEQKTKDILSWNSTDFTGHGNADAISIAVAAEELKKRPEMKKMLIVLSDGLPAENTPQQVKKIIEKTRKEKIKVIGIGFGPERELKKNEKVYREMYGEDIVLAMPDELSKELVKILRSTVARG